MKSNFITTVCGPDIPGIIKSLARVTRRSGGEWLTCKVIKLDGRFAAIMNVVIDENLEKAVQSTLEKNFPNLQFLYSPPSAVSRKSTKTINLVVDCIDRPGLTGDLSNILANLDSLEGKVKDKIQSGLDSLQTSRKLADLSEILDFTPQEWALLDGSGEDAVAQR